MSELGCTETPKRAWLTRIMSFSVDVGLPVEIDDDIDILDRDTRNKRQVVDKVCLH